MPPKKPFFSVCIEVVNRAGTIRKVLQCIQSQSCRDFELIIVDNGSTDISRAIIEEELKRFTDIHVRFMREERKPNEIAGWNRPLIFAQGTYIAICEGDDYYEPDHLLHAKKILEQIPIAGLYVSELKFTEKTQKIIITNPQLKLRALMQFDWCPPPSCVIFRRVSNDGIQFDFDETFVWAGEYSLYLKILTNGFFVIENNEKKYVSRGVRFYNKTSFHLQDMLKMRESGYFSYGEKEAAKADSQIVRLASQYLAFNLGLGALDLKILKIVIKYATLPRAIRILFSIRFITFVFQGMKKRIRIPIDGE